MFNEKDLSQIQQLGISMDTIERQLAFFREGFPFLAIEKAATAGDGILRLSDPELQSYQSYFESALPNKNVVKFVPASGAASRMFKSLYAFKDSYDGSLDAYLKFAADKSSGSMFSFFAELEHFAFYEDLLDAIGGEDRYIAFLNSKMYQKIIEYLLTDSGLDYGNLPKGLLKFHKYSDSVRTPVEEHMVEGANYCQDSNKIVRLHFTVSPEHRTKFLSLLNNVIPIYEDLYGVHFEVSLSEQKPATDTLAVDMGNNPFRDKHGDLLFRPGGHGALIENLNDLDGDLIFIKNIDNVVPDKIKQETYRYKKALAGLLLAYQEKIFAYLEMLENGTENASLPEIEAFLEEKLCVKLPDNLFHASHAERVEFLVRKLNRPLRICGMVQNEGEPGGGPFWVHNADGTSSLQILESAQLDGKNPEHMAMMKNATHFNPVDLVCATKNREGQKYHLPNFVDPMTGFIAYKSQDGKDLKALELPGLWNGAMADWNTIFVEVPIITFNPVKTVFDLLRPQHQA